MIITRVAVSGSLVLYSRQRGKEKYIPRYCLYKDGIMAGEYKDIREAKKAFKRTGAPAESRQLC